MYRRVIQLALILPSIVFAQDAGHAGRQIKALSPDEIQAYTQGHGMGLALAAELNHYPGPRHVLEHRTELGLAAAQLVATQKFYDRMHQEAVRLGHLVVEKERALDRRFAEQRIDLALLRADVAEIARLHGELRTVHLRAHLEMRAVLSQEQIERYDSLRGYARGNHR